jgi:hypothetical protein
MVLSTSMKEMKSAPLLSLKKYVLKLKRRGNRGEGDKREMREERRGARKERGWKEREERRRST